MIKRHYQPNNTMQNINRLYAVFQGFRRFHIEKLARLK